MKRINLLLLAFCPLLLCTNCKSDVDAIHISEYVYVNNASETVTLSARNPYADDEYENIKILPGEKYVNELVNLVFVPPFFDIGLNLRLFVDNGKMQVTSSRFYDNPTGLLNEKNYELVSERKRERHYRFIFTDDYFKDGEPIENMPE